MRQHAWLLGLALCTAPCAGQQPPPDDLNALINRGRLADALTLARLQHDSLRIGEVLELQGQVPAADSLYRSLRRGGGPQARVATARLALLAERRGARDSALALASEVSDAWYAGHAGWSADELVAAGQALARFAGGQPDAVRDALRAFDAASAADPMSPTGRLEAAELLLAHYNAPDANSDFGRVLGSDSSNVRALVGLANVAAFEGNGSALPRTRAALAINPTSVPALLLLARLHLEGEQYDSARVATDRALAADSTRLESWAAAGALAWVQGDTVAFAAATRRALQINPRGADYFAAVAEAAARHRRYAGAAELAARGVALDSNSVPSLVALGTNLLRTQQVPEGRAALERAFALDPFHLWTKNALDLLDQMVTFETHRSERFEIVAPADQAALLSDVLLPLLEEAYDSLAMRYDYRPPTPIRLELFDRHADFSVRTIGLAGLGALGVSFGTTLVMDAPSARPAGEFNLGSTAWHELAHTFTLGRSMHRVPRWFSEGLSVLEERRARAGWGARANPLFVQALAAGDLLPIDRLNDGFIRPDRPERLGLSYYQASLVVEFLEQEIGIAGIRRMLDGYGRGESTPALVQSLTGAPSAAFDANFLGWLRTRFAVPLASIAAGDPLIFGEPLTAAQAALAQGDSAGARAQLEEARKRFPTYGGAAGPGPMLAALLHASGQLGPALTEISQVTHGDETALPANRLEATWQLERADTSRAIAALERATWIATNDAALWQLLGGLAAASGDHAAAVRARRAVVALGSSDPAVAGTDLAESLLAMGDAVAARREVLRVLERAPGYERAQTLLLRIRSTGGGTSR
ncbi:MAG TPA: hypothetical protein VFN22_05030 [Gemmatimonadales bacterium]|nr:hypothetical protein [Gemmatimonadales bacterium]